MSDLPTRPQGGGIETYGVEPIPPEDRTSNSVDFLRIASGSVLTTATVVLGTIPVALGLSLTASMTAIGVGVVVGALLVAPLATIGQRTHTNNAVASGAHFGVAGRVVGSVLSLLVAITFFTLSVWVCGDAIVAGLGQVFPSLVNEVSRALAYALAALVTYVICIVGYKWLLAANKFIAPSVFVLLIVGLLAFGGSIDVGYPGAQDYPLGGFWVTWFAALLIVMANPISYGPFLGDWSRYVPESVPPHRLRVAFIVAQLASLVPFLFGAATATLVPEAGDYVSGLIHIAPQWYVIPLIVVLIGGSLCGGVSSLYGTGLDFSSVIPKLSRMQATLAIGAVSIALVYLGRFVFNLVDTINAFTTLILVLAAPWVAVLLIGFFTRRGHYLVEDLQVFNRGQQGGAYWFVRGFNPRSLSAWAVGAACGLLTANTTLIAGPLRNAFGGIDISFFASFLISGLVYFALLRAYPEPRYAFGPEGPRWVAADQARTQAPAVITVDETLERMHRPPRSEQLDEQHQRPADVLVEPERLVD